MRTSTASTISVTMIRHLITLVNLTFAAGVLLVLFVSSCNGPVSSASEEQSTFTAADTFDIATLANTLQPGKIQSIGICYIYQKPITSSTIASAKIVIRAPEASYVQVYFEPILIQPNEKRYYRASLSNITWPESDAFKKDTSHIIRNNWITTKNYLYFYDMTVLNLDSCTIDVTLSDANVDTVTHLLNQISAGQYEYDPSVTRKEKLPVSEITSVRWMSDSDVANVSITCSGSKVFQIHFKNGVVLIRSISQMLL